MLLQYTLLTFKIRSTHSKNLLEINYSSYSSLDRMFTYSRILEIMLILFILEGGDGTLHLKEKCRKVPLLMLPLMPVASQIQ